MKRKRIAVEKGLTQVERALKKAGYSIVTLDQQTTNWQNASAVVVSGMEENLLGIQDTMTSAPVIEAKGLTPQQIISEVETRSLD